MTVTDSLGNVIEPGKEYDMAPRREIVDRTDMDIHYEGDDGYESKLSDTESPFGVGESDPTGKEQHEHGAKTDAGKPDCSLLLMFGKALSEVARVGTYGAEKYSRGGWQGVPDGINRYTAALLRHLTKEHYEELDSDLPVLHAAQVAWNALARLELMLREKEE